MAGTAKNVAEQKSTIYCKKGKHRRRMRNWNWAQCTNTVATTRTHTQPNHPPTNTQKTPAPSNAFWFRLKARFQLKFIVCAKTKAK